MKSLKLAEGLGSVSRRQSEFIKERNSNVASFVKHNRSNRVLEPVRVSSSAATADAYLEPQAARMETSTSSTSSTKERLKP